jgi:hypothetical protein
VRGDDECRVGDFHSIRMLDQDGCEVKLLSQGSVDSIKFT